MTAPADTWSELTQPQQRAVDALAAGLSLEAAAAAGGVGVRQLRRWRAECRAFQQALSEARRATFAASLDRSRSLVARAADTLEAVMTDPEAPPTARVAAARVALDHATRAWELVTDLERRRDPLEYLLVD